MRRIANYRPTCAVALSLAAGIIAAALFGLLPRGYRLIALIPFVIAAIVLLARPRVRRYAAIPIALVVGFCCLCGIADVYEYNRIEDGYGVLEGRVEGLGIISPDGYSYFEIGNATFEGEPVKGGVRVFIRIFPEERDFNAGDTIRATGTISQMQFSLLRVPEEGYSPFDWSFVSAYSSDTTKSFSANQVQKLVEGELPFFKKIAYNSTIRYYENCDEDSAGIAVALMFGDKSLLSDEMYSNVKSSGLAHIMAVSGLHVGMLSAALYYVLKKLKAKPWIRFFVVAVVLLCYGALCGYPPSIVRATVMTLVALLGTAIGKKTDPMSSLGLACVILLLINPLNVFSVGFLLSVFAVLGILLFYPHLKRAFPQAQNKLLSILFLSVFANLFTFAISIVSFGTTSLVFLLSNILVLPILGFIYVILLIITLFVAIVPSAYQILTVTDFLVLPIKFTASMLGGEAAQLDFSTLLSANFAQVLSVLVALFVIVFAVSPFLFLSKRKKTAVVSLCASVGIIGATCFSLLPL